MQTEWRYDVCKEMKVLKFCHFSQNFLIGTEFYNQVWNIKFLFWKFQMTIPSRSKVMRIERGVAFFLGHPIYKGVPNLPNQLSNFCLNWGMNHGVKAFHVFYKLILQRFCSLCSKIAIIPPIITGKCFNFLETSLKTMIWGN